MVIAGDSIAAGLGLDDFKDSVGGKLAEDLSAATGSRLVCENRAYHGASAAELAAQLEGVTADLAFLTIGTRDAISATPLPAFKAALERALTALAGAQQVIVLGCGNVEDVPALPRLFHPLGRRRCRVYNQAIAEVLAAHPQARLARLDSLGPTRDHFSSDGYHPNRAGHELIYAQLAKSLD
jgi:lysophospholipase L1-like esterase